MQVCRVWMAVPFNRSEEAVVIDPSVLALVSAELAAQGQGEGKRNLADLVYQDFSDEDGDAGNSSMEEFGTASNTGKRGHRVTISDASPVVIEDPGPGQGGVAGGVPGDSKKQPLDRDASCAEPLPQAEAQAGKALAGGTHPSGDDGSSIEEQAKGRIVSASVASLDSLFGGQSAVSLETEIARDVGLEQLTRLSRATCVRVVVGHLQVDPIAVGTVMAAHSTTTKKRQSRVPNLLG